MRWRKRKPPSLLELEAAYKAAMDAYEVAEAEYLGLLRGQGERSDLTLAARRLAEAADKMYKAELELGWALPEGDDPASRGYSADEVLANLWGDIAATYEGR